MAMRRIPIDWDKFMKDVKQKEKKLEELNVDLDSYIDHGPTTKELYDMLMSGNFSGCFNYPGGPAQFIKDYESGMFDEDDV